MVGTILQLAAILGFPFVVSGTVAYLAWDDLPRPWLYFVVATGVLYVVDWLIFIFLGETITGLFAVAQGDTARTVDSGFTGLVLFKLYAKPLLGFSVLALPILAAIYSVFKRSE
jgi:hypothetical protein